MNAYPLQIAGQTLLAMASGALWWPGERLLCVSDLHLGKAERTARRGHSLLPPYECAETLARLDAAIEATSPATIVCLGDSFDDPAAAEGLDDETRLRLAGHMTGRRWIWIAGNHDPGPPALDGEHCASFGCGPLTFRHIATGGAPPGEISGHYHPKAALGPVRRPCFVTDGARLILPAFGTYTGGLDCTAPEIAALLGPHATAILTGPTPVAFPLATPRGRRRIARRQRA